jgi:hypothetical protein
VAATGAAEVVGATVVDVDVVVEEGGGTESLAA